MIELVFGLVAVGLFVGGVRALCFCAVQSCSPLRGEVAPETPKGDKPRWMRLMTARHSRAIRRGAQFLDNKLGTDWPQRINVSTLNVASDRECLLGQLCGGSYVDALPKLMPGMSGPSRTAVAKQFGLFASHEDIDAQNHSYERLTQLWKKKIDQRRRQLQTV